MLISSDRLFLRKWDIEDANYLYKYAKDEEIGPITGWPSHKSILDSEFAIKKFLNGNYCYAICEKNTNIPIGSIELMFESDIITNDNECKLGFWLGKEFWGRGYIPEIAKELIKYAFTELNIVNIWSGYFDGNMKSKKVQDKLGFVYYEKKENFKVSSLNEIRTLHVTLLTKEKWLGND